MYTNIRLRSIESLDDLCTVFDDYTWSERSLLNEMAHRALANVASSPIAYRASASEAGLRSREPINDGSVMERPMTPLNGDGGNVKVVVRVRKFVKRGMSQSHEQYRID